MVSYEWVSVGRRLVAVGFSGKLVTRVRAGEANITLQSGDFHLHGFIANRRNQINYRYGLRGSLWCLSQTHAHNQINTASSSFILVFIPNSLHHRCAF